MIYFLDFDKILFDTDRFLPHVFGKPAAKQLPGLPYRELVAEFNALVESGILSFVEGELRPFLFSDAEVFIREHECVLVTAGPLAWQKAKIESSLPDVRVIFVTDTSDTPKGPLVRDALAGAAGSSCFVDDRPAQLDSVAALCPSVRLFEMRRDGAPGSGRYPVVHSLAELP